MDFKAIQEALSTLGFDPGPVDGVPGRRTIAAIRAFQAKHGLVVDGIVGRQTAELLFAGGAAPAARATEVPPTMPWLCEAYRLIGTREEPGAGSNQAIVGWAHDLDLHEYNGDDIPWCGLFVAHCIGSQLPEASLPTKPLTARAWAKFGQGGEPGLGAILVFWRENKNGFKGHVGFYWAEDDDAYHVLGGNQSDSVSITRISKSRLLAARWPDGLQQPAHSQRLASRSGKLSTNEA